MPEFVSLATLLEPNHALGAQEQSRDEPIEESAEVAEPAAPAVTWCDEAAREARLFRAHLREQLEEASAILFERIAKEIVGRELLLMPANLRNILDVAVNQYCADGPLRVRVANEDIERFNDYPLPIFPDESLRGGDVVLELENGVVDLRLEARLEAVISVQ